MVHENRLRTIKTMVIAEDGYATSYRDQEILENFGEDWLARLTESTYALDD